MSVHNKQQSTNKHMLFPFLFAVLSLVSLAHAEDTVIDKREGENLSLKCRFSEQHQMGKEFLYYWARFSGTKYENVAIGGDSLASNYR